jgi:DNA-binding CsgD family transcriptional regulator
MKQFTDEEFINYIKTGISTRNAEHIRNFLENFFSRVSAIEKQYEQLSKGLFKEAFDNIKIFPWCNSHLNQIILAFCTDDKSVSADITTQLRPITMKRLKKDFPSEYNNWLAMKRIDHENSSADLLCEIIDDALMKTSNAFNKFSMSNINRVMVTFFVPSSVEDISRTEREIKKNINILSPFILNSPLSIYMANAKKLFWEKNTYIKKAEAQKIGDYKDGLQGDPRSLDREKAERNLIINKIEKEKMSPVQREICKLLKQEYTEEKIVKELDISRKEFSREMLHIRNVFKEFQPTRRNADSNISSAIKQKALDKNKKVKKKCPYSEEDIDFMEKSFGVLPIFVASSRYNIPKQTIYHNIAKGNIDVDKNISMVVKALLLNIKENKPINTPDFFIGIKSLEDWIKNNWRKKGSKNYNEWKKLISKNKQIPESTIRWKMNQMRARLDLPKTYFRSEEPTKKKLDKLLKEYENLR